MKAMTITSPKGFRAAAVKAGIKASKNLDVALIVADSPCAAAGVFTTNKVVGAPVVISREHIKNGRAQAIFVNAGNSNVCTGKRGERDAAAICRQVSKALKIDAADVLVCSTGIIGHFLPMDKVRSGIDAAAGRLGTEAQRSIEVAHAIMTTDTKVKMAARMITLGGKKVTLAGTAKGSGMIAPNMATMLAFITTDAAISASMLQKALVYAAGITFNKVTVDNHMSTSDTALVLASGLAGNRRITRSDKDFAVFQKALWQVCDELAQQMAADGEGAKAAIRIEVRGAANAQDARLALRSISDSPLVRTAFAGADPNWGRIISAVGYSGAKCVQEKMECRIAGVTVFKAGQPRRFDAQKLSAKMKQKQWSVQVDLGMGKASDFCYTCDLTHEYITINADYHT